MYKIIVIALCISHCRGQLAIPQHQQHRAYTYQRIFDVDGLLPIAAPVAAPVAVAPAPIHPIATSQPHIQSHVQYSQEILPVQHLSPTDPDPVGVGLHARSGPQIVQLRGDDVPVVVHFQTQSARVQVEQSHLPSAPGEVTITRSEDEPHRVIHEVIRPVIQEVREIIQPYRRLSQEVRPVEEAVHTNVAANAPVAPVANQAVQLAPVGQVQQAGVSNFSGYIQQILEQLRARNVQQPFTASRAQINVAPVAHGAGNAQLVRHPFAPVQLQPLKHV